MFGLKKKKNTETQDKGKEEVKVSADGSSKPDNIMPSRIKEGSVSAAAANKGPDTGTVPPSRVKEGAQASAVEEKDPVNVDMPDRVEEDFELSTAAEEPINVDMPDRVGADAEASIAAAEEGPANADMPDRVGADVKASAAEKEEPVNADMPDRVGADVKASAAEKEEPVNADMPDRVGADVKASAAEKEEEPVNIAEPSKLSDQKDEDTDDDLKAESPARQKATKQDVGEEAELYSIEGKGIGIDLGTTNSEVSYIVEGQIHNLKIRNDTIIPSALFFESRDKIYYGKPALKRGMENKKSVIRHFKRKLQDKNDVFHIEFANKDCQTGDGIKDDILAQAGCVVGPDGTMPISGETAATLFLRYLREESMKQIGNITKAVITVPANFNNVEVEAIKRAGLQAGFTEVKILKEPTAAAIAYSVEQKAENKKILVYDFGGGTFDVSVLDMKVDGSGEKKVEVLDTGGDARLGGEDFTQELVKYIYEKLEEAFDLNMESLESSGLSPEEFSWNENGIYKEAEQKKSELSESDKTTISFPILYVKKGEQKKFELPLTRKKFEDIVKDKVKHTLNILDNILNGATLKGKNIDVVALAGGTSLLPIIQESVKKHFKKLPTFNKNAAMVISEGAAIVAQLEWDKIEELVGGQVTYLENTAYDFGVDLKGKKFDCLIKSGEKLPTKVEKSYSLSEDNQQNLRISVFRRDKMSQKAERTFDKGVEFVDEILITNLPPMKQVEANVIVSFELTQEDILNVDVAIKDASDKLVNSRDVKIEKISSIKG